MELEEITGYLNELSDAYQKGGLQGCKDLILSKTEEWKVTPLNIAVIGESGVGKSSFINTIRGLTSSDKGAAAVGYTETTLKPMPYDHIHNPMMKLWDLPGVNTPINRKENYLSFIDIDKYDFFLMLSTTRVRETDVWLREEITKRNKTFFFLRTKFDTDITNALHDNPKNTTENVIKEVKESIRSHLGQTSDDNIFCITCRQTNLYDYDHLTEKIIDQFPLAKRSALILSMCASGKSVVAKKVDELKKQRPVIALKLAVQESSPQDTLDGNLDPLLFKQPANDYFKQFGLDKISLERQAKLTFVDEKHLKVIVCQTFSNLEVSDTKIKDLAQKAKAQAKEANADARRAKEAADARQSFWKRVLNLLSYLFGKNMSEEKIMEKDQMLDILLDEMKTVAFEVFTYIEQSTST